MKLLYDLLFYTVLPFIALYQWLCSKFASKPHRLAERFAMQQSQGPRGGIWIHASSVGEVNAAIPIIDRLLLEVPDCRLTLTTQTLTGSKRVQSLYQGRVNHQLAPFDLPNLVNRFVDRIAPKMLIIMETELWPNIISSCYQRSIPIVIANARISNRAYQRYTFFKRFFKPWLKNISSVLGQSELDAQRYVDLGVPIEHVKVLGNIKYASQISPEMRELATAFKQQLGERPIFIAASTHDKEEAIVLAAFKKIKAQYEDCLLILVPRHPKRIPQVLPLCQTWHTYLRSEFNGQTDIDILLVDTIGECMMLYGCADIAFIGGSLVPIGGHNPVEPGLWGIPILCGPHTENFTAIMSDFQRVDGIEVVNSTEQIANTVLNYINNCNNKKETAQKVQRLIASQAHALDGHLATIKKILKC